MTTPVSSSSGASGAAQDLNNGLAQMAQNSQTFLTLLTTQLQHQDPLSPLDTNQFTAQLTQMTGVEQQLLGNQLLQTLVTEQGLSQGANLIGKAVTAPGATSSDPPVTGVVSAVTEVNGKTMLDVGGTQIPLSSVTDIFNPSPASGSGQGA